MASFKLFHILFPQGLRWWNLVKEDGSSEWVGSLVSTFLVFLGAKGLPVSLAVFLVWKTMKDLNIRRDDSHGSRSSSQIQMRATWMLQSAPEMFKSDLKLRVLRVLRVWRVLRVLHVLHGCMCCTCKTWDHTYQTRQGPQHLLGRHICMASDKTSDGSLNSEKPWLSILCKPHCKMT